MATQKQFINGQPVPVTPRTQEQRVEDNTPGKQISSQQQDYDENEHGDDLAEVNPEVEKAVDVSPKP